tara:strand:+ start:7891 stop:8418 length:528 start_codon:yes stop_codon:yes gene_type:complete
VKKDKLLILAFCLSALLVSCSQSEHEEVPESKSFDEKPLKSDDNAYIDESKITAIKKVEKNTERAALVGKRTISFNGEKYLFDEKKLRKGSKVRNIYMSETGTIKGTFVVVAKAGEILDLSFKSKTKIAKDTFRLIPAQADDLMTIYNELLLNKSIAIVELEVMYSGGNGGALEY